MSKELSLFAMDAFLYAMEGLDTSSAIERAERNAQQRIVRSSRLPKVVNELSLPDEISRKGVTDDMDYPERFAIIKQNNIVYTRSIYEKLGITITSDLHDSFFDVELPEGWKIVPTDHHMWNDLLDSKGRVRASFFYKGDYDRTFINFNRRYSISAVAEGDDPFDTEKPLIGIVSDGKDVIYTTTKFANSSDVLVRDSICRSILDLLNHYMDQNYPLYQDFLAYWD